MPVNECVMGPGSYDLDLTVLAPWSLWTTIEPFGHIIVTPQWVDPILAGDTGMLAASRYTGVMLTKTADEQGLHFSGAHIAWWLGDDTEEIGPIIEEQLDYESETLSDVLPDLLPSAITIGKVYDTGLPLYTGTNGWETPMSAIRTVCATVGAEFRVNNDGSFDAGQNDLIYNLLFPEVLMVRRGWGDNLDVRGISTQQMSTKLDAYPYASRAILVNVDQYGVGTEVAAQPRDPAPTWIDIHGNVIERTLMLQNPPTEPVEATTYLTYSMNEHTLVQNQNVSTDQYEISEGNLMPGDAFYVFDPPAFIDETYQIPYRGDNITPAIVRLVQASWPFRKGMGVYYRSSDPTATMGNQRLYTDLTRWVQWEEE
jgi:hypothetical protein